MYGQYFLLRADRSIVTGVRKLARPTEQERQLMTSRRELLGSIAATGAAFALSGALFGEGPAHAQEAPLLLAGHFHPKGKAPSVHTIRALQESAANLPFADTRDLEEQTRGFIAPLPDKQIMADTGNVAWDHERFLSNETQDAFDSIWSSPPGVVHPLG
jgi:hypothetical protein